MGILQSLSSRFQVRRLQVTDPWPRRQWHAPFSWVARPQGAPDIDSNAEGEALRRWRRRAVDIVIAVGVVLHLPALILFLAGEGPPFDWPTRIVIITGYCASIALALLRRMDHEIRTWLLIAFLYLVALLGSASFADGPYVRSLPVIAPVVAIVLIGVRAATIVTVLSACVLMLAPFLRWVPGVSRVLGGPSDQATFPLGIILLQGLALTAVMLFVMTLVERFYRFLLTSLASERRAAFELTAATQRLEREIEERRHLEHEIARVADEERRGLGHEVHDGVCQQLTGALLRCQALELRLERGIPPTRSELDALSSLLGETIHEARAVAQGLCPLAPRPDALAPALRELAVRAHRMSGVPCEFHAAGDVLVRNPGTAQHLYRIAQEALSNAVRHARASRIRIELRGADDGLRLKVQDDGVGLPDHLRAAGLGLRTMTFRAQALEGELVIEPAEGGGTRVACHVPRATCFPPSDRHAAIPVGSAI
jgi:signal transduction histidine kinase